jgi:hypothetical protein
LRIGAVQGLQRRVSRPTSAILLNDFAAPTKSVIGVTVALAQLLLVTFIIFEGV